MYGIVYGNDCGNSFRTYSVFAEAATLEALSAQRKLSGDLVFDLDTGEIVQDDAWLFQWEREDPECYARRCMKMQKVLGGYRA